MIFSITILKNYIVRCDFGAIDILSTGSFITVPKHFLNARRTYFVFL